MEAPHMNPWDIPNLCAQYALDNHFLDEPGWKHFKRRAKNKKTLDQKLKQHVLQHKRHAPIFMYGVEIPRDWESARQLNTKKVNTKWAMQSS